jgi:hypothetical protein
MTTNSKGVTATKEQRARDAADAMREYEAEKLTIWANTARLRALRLAKEAGRLQDAKTAHSQTAPSTARNTGGHKRGHKL